MRADSIAGIIVYIPMASIVRYNAVLRDHHNLVYIQRIEALNNSLKLMNERATEMLGILESLNIDYGIVAPVRSHIKTTQSYANTEISRIKSQMQIISKCNQNYLKTQIIITDDDIRRYLNYMEMDYLPLVKDIVNITLFIDKACDVHLRKVNELLRYVQTRYDNTSFIDWLCSLFTRWFGANCLE